MSTDVQPITITMPHYITSALVWLTINDPVPDSSTSHTYFCCNIVGDRPFTQKLLSTPMPADETYVIYWPGVLEIPWPAGMTAHEAVAAWKIEKVA